jgi:hypothetical protein
MCVPKRFIKNWTLHCIFYKATGTRICCPVLRMEHGAMVSELQLAAVQVPRPRLESMDLDNKDSKVITAGSSPAESDRQIMLLAPADYAATRQSVARHDTLRPVSDIIRTFTDMVGITTRANARGIAGETPSLPINIECKRYMRVQLSMNDPTLPQAYRTAHRLYVTGCPLVDMRSHGCTMRHIVGIGVNYDDWTYRCGYGLREVALMGGSWHDAVDMGFSPVHISERDKNGTALLRDPPFQLTWNDLKYDLGLTIDEAIFEIGVTSADLAMLGENLSSLIHRGFGTQHAQHMNEPVCNFESTLKASSEDIQYVFGSSTSYTKPRKEHSACTQSTKTVHRQANKTQHKQTNFVFK